NVSTTHAKLTKGYHEFDNALVYYTATILYPPYEHYLEAIWKVPDNYNKSVDGPYYKKDWLLNNHKRFLAL
ncbi:hypothetical protein K469DRAFT_588821, partial [Zopfia rhizophila CBS 207.26]